MKKLTDEEIIKALECCGKEYSCEKCILNNWLNKKRDCVGKILGNAFDLINRQRAEIERLEEMLDGSVSSERNVVDNIGYEKSEAIKEFAEELKNCFAISGDYLDIINIIDNLVKEMTEVNENDRA